jgi:excisionase family DNA binding protein
MRTVLREELRRFLAPTVARQNIGVESTRSTVPSDVLWDVAMACKFLNVSSSWLYHRAAAGKIPCIRVGHNLRFDPEALRAWVRGERRGGRVVPLK